MDRPRTPLTGIVHTRDSGATLERALTSLRFVTELVVVDMASEDDTLAIARRLADRVVGIPVAPRVDGVRNAQLETAAHEWIVVLDSDEYLAADAPDLIDALIREHGHRYDAFAVPRFNFIAGQLMRRSGWYPDHQVRVFRRGTVAWTDAHHVAQTVTTGRSRQLTLTPPDCLHIHHENYRDLRQVMRRQLDYALSQRYPVGAAAFDFDAYLVEAREQLTARMDPGEDGDVSRALALVMAWDAIVRGLAHWDSLDPRPPLPTPSTLLAASARPSAPDAAWRRWLSTHHRAAHAARMVLRPFRLLADRVTLMARRG